MVIALDGRSGAGKSTIAAALLECLEAVVLSGDDFYAGGTTIRTDPPHVLADVCIDWRRQVDILKALQEAGVARYQPFDWEAFDGSPAADTIVLQAKPFIILEGTYSARPELRHLTDVLCLVEVSDETRMRRLLAREGAIGDWEKQWHRAEDWYFANLAPNDAFDIVISEKGFAKR
ncbi:uridine kinase family protein [Pseudokordiimonas caeni]|uniref:uridine kinase family protein n=1 Tax=Pseudokordiimonas caeni TaxID=2997908 RepID=UPI002811539F|nr:hypothetical protein [Pseudokordiimonas caeni]